MLDQTSLLSDLSRMNDLLRSCMETTVEIQLLPNEARTENGDKYLLTKVGTSLFNEESKCSEGNSSVENGSNYDTQRIISNGGDKASHQEVQSSFYEHQISSSESFSNDSKSSTEKKKESPTKPLRGILKASKNIKNLCSTSPQDQRKFTERLLPMESKLEKQSSCRGWDAVKKVTFKLSNSDQTEPLKVMKEEQAENITYQMDGQELPIGVIANAEERKADSLTDPLMETPIHFANIVEIVHRDVIRDKKENLVQYSDQNPYNSRKICSRHSTGSFDADSGLECDCLSDEVFDDQLERENLFHQNVGVDNSVKSETSSDEEDGTMIIHDVQQTTNENSFDSIMSGKKWSPIDNISQVEETLELDQDSCQGQESLFVHNDESSPICDRKEVFNSKETNMYSKISNANPLQTLNLDEFKSGKKRYSRMFISQFKSKNYKEQRAEMLKKRDQLSKNREDSTEIDSPAPLPSPPSSIFSSDSCDSPTRSATPLLDQNPDDSTNFTSSMIDQTPSEPDARFLPFETKDLELPKCESKVSNSAEKFISKDLRLKIQNFHPEDKRTHEKLKEDYHKQLVSCHILQMRALLNTLEKEIIPENKVVTRFVRAKKLLKSFSKTLGVGGFFAMMYILSLLLILTVTGPFIEIGFKDNRHEVI